MARFSVEDFLELFWLQVEELLSPPLLSWPLFIGTGRFCTGGEPTLDKWTPLNNNVKSDMAVPSGEARFFSTLALISELFPLFLFKALGSSLASPIPLAFSFFRAAILAADRLRAVVAGGCGGLCSKKRMSSPSEKPRPNVGAWGVAGLWVPLGTSQAALGDIRASLPCEEEEEEEEEEEYLEVEVEGLGPAEFCSTLFWISSALCKRFCRSSFCFCFCCFSNSVAEMDFRGASGASFEAKDK